MTLPLDLKTAIKRLRSPDPAKRRAAADQLGEMVSNMVDIRAAQPALTLCLKDPDIHVATAACKTVELRARLGADIGMAVPVLATLREEEDKELRELSRRSIEYADVRLPGILKALDGSLVPPPPSLNLRTSRFPTMNPDESREPSSFRVGPWGKKPWESNAARIFFAKLFSGTDVDMEMEMILEIGQDNLEEVRAAAYLLQVLGIPNVWPGSGSKLPKHLESAISILESSLNNDPSGPNATFFAPWVKDPEITTSIHDQLDQLKTRLKNCSKTKQK